LTLRPLDGQRDRQVIRPRAYRAEEQEKDGKRQCRGEARKRPADRGLAIRHRVERIRTD
jgi:hypothetical protein